MFLSIEVITYKFLKAPQIVVLLKSRFSRIFNSFVLLVGLTAIAVKFANFKKKPKNTVEISEDIIVENVTAE